MDPQVGKSICIGLRGKGKSHGLGDCMKEFGEFVKGDGEGFNYRSGRSNLYDIFMLYNEVLELEMEVVETKAKVLRESS
jgi:hypothetical protein